jgi:hypothetical protein
MASDVARRDLLKAAGLFAAGGGFVPELLQGSASEAAAAGASAIGQRELLQGLDGMSRAADDGRDPFVEGHGAAAVLAAVFFCQENRLDTATQEAILRLLQARLLGSSLYAPRREEPAEAKLVAGLVEDLDAGIGSLRASGHSIIFATLSLKALREVPQAATPARVNGLRATLRSFEARRAVPRGDPNAIPDLGDARKFVRFVFEEYRRALDLYLEGKGHHGFAGHLLTIGHALLELSRLGYVETARKGLPAYAQFVALARQGADLGGRRVAAAPPRSAAPLDRDYWTEQARRRIGSIVSSHVVKYPYSFYALLRELDDDDLRQSVRQKLFHLTAVS